MPEMGSSPRKSRSQAAASTRLSSSGRSLRDQAIAQRQATTGQPQGDVSQDAATGEMMPSVQGSTPQNTPHSKRRATVWQALFGQERRTSRRTALQQAKRKDINSSGIEPPHNLLQRLERPTTARSQSTNAQASAKLAQDQIKQAVLGRSRQLNGSTAANSGENVHRWSNQSHSRQDETHRAPAARNALREQPRTIAPTFSPHRTETREQTSALALRREARQRSRRGAPGNSVQSLSAAQSLQTDRSPSQSRKRDGQTRSRSRGFSAGLYAARMLIFSVGVGVLAGTILSVWDPTSRSSAGASQQTKKAVVAVSASASTNQSAIAASGDLSPGTAPAVQLPKMGQELTSLKATVQALALQSPRLTPGIFLFDLDTAAYLDLNGGASFSAASTIKVPVLVAFLQDVDAGKIRLDELLTMRKELVAGGSGEMQSLPPGTQFTALETITKMITISDNTATNMIIARLGGMAALNQRFRSWGLVSTAINNVLPDLQGTNTTSPKDMALLMTRISQGELVSMRSRDRMLDIMQRTVNRSQLPQGLDKGATIAHKTGDIGGMIGDVGLIDMPSGKRYALTVLVKRSFNDDQAYDLVQKVSRTVYQYLSRTPEAQSRPAFSQTSSGQPARTDSDLPAHSGNAPNAATDTTITQSTPLDTATR